MFISITNTYNRQGRRTKINTDKALEVEYTTEKYCLIGTVFNDARFLSFEII